ncbi:MAG: hypothetical protein RLZZ623_1157 [Actinomycetota bacterium]
MSTSGPPLDPALDAAARLLDERIGLKPDPSFRPRLARALRDVADARSVATEFLVESMSLNTPVLDLVLDRVTVQETAFFRHSEHFDAIVSSVLPSITGPVRMWSSACANGQEAYSLAMLLRETGVSGSVLATDISPAALRRTMDAGYLDREMGGISADRRRLHFDLVGQRWQAVQPLRDSVTVKRHNLLDPIPTEVAECQIVMCRNVLIYFTQRHAEGFLDRLADAMHRDAYLFVGGAETLWHMTTRFEPMQIGECFVYRPRLRRSAPALPRVSAATPVQRPITPKPAPAVSPIPRPAAESACRPVAAPMEEPEVDQQQLGAALLADGDIAEAIVEFRRWAYLAPDDPSAHFHLGLALDRAEQHRSAGRAYRAALSALDRSDAAQIVALLDGYDRTEFRRLLVQRGAVSDRAPAPIHSEKLEAKR